MSVFPFPDIDFEKALAVLFEPLVPDENHVGTTTPPNLQTAMPFLKVNRYGGPYDPATGTDRADLNVEVYAATRDAARALLLAALAILRPQTKAGPHTIDTVAVNVGPRALPYDNPAVRRWGATLSITSRG